MATEQKAKKVSKVESDFMPEDIDLLDISQLGPMLKDRRGDLSIRQAANDAGVSFSTFARVESGAQPDLATFSRLCSWLGVSAGRFFTKPPERNITPLDGAVAHLFADPRLTPDTASKLSAVLRDMYEALASQREEPSSVVACHLRATNVMRPGVPDRVASILQDMRDEIASQVAAGKL